MSVPLADEKIHKPKPPNLELHQTRLQVGPRDGETGAARSPRSPRAPKHPESPKSGLSTPKASECPRSPRILESPRKTPDSPLRGAQDGRTKHEALQERHNERRLTKQESALLDKLLTKPETLTHNRHNLSRKLSADYEESRSHREEREHHRSPKRSASERRRSQRSSVHEHRRMSSVNSAPVGSTRRASVRATERRRSSVHDRDHRRLSQDHVSLSDAGANTNGSPVHIEYPKRHSHIVGPYMPPALSVAYRTPAAEMLVASLIMTVGGVALITSFATGIKVWMVAGCVCMGLGGMFMILGICWYFALKRQKRENESRELKVISSKQLLELARTSGKPASGRRPSQAV